MCTWRLLTGRNTSASRKLDSRLAISIGNPVKHFQQHELGSGFAWHTFPTRNTFGDYLRKCIVPHWSEYRAETLYAGKVEIWQHLYLWQESAAIRKPICILFDHGASTENP